MSELKAKPILPEKKKLSPKEKSEIKKKLQELFKEEVWLDGTTDTLVFCVNSHLQNKYILEVLSKYKCYLLMSLFEEKEDK